MTPRQKLDIATAPCQEMLSEGFSLTSTLLDLSEIDRARLARVLVELGRHIRRHTRRGEQKEIDE